MIDVTDLVRLELDGLYGNDIINEMNEIINLYEAYEGTGQKWNIDDADYTPTIKKTNIPKSTDNSLNKGRGLCFFVFSIVTQWRMKHGERQTPHAGQSIGRAGENVLAYSI